MPESGRSANDRVNAVDHESIQYAIDNPDKSRGWLEAYLIRRRAPDAEKLPPLPKLR